MDYFALTKISGFIYYNILKLTEHSFVSKADVRKKKQHIKWKMGYNSAFKGLRETIMQAI
jgi:hypothetical protein